MLTIQGWLALNLHKLFHAPSILRTPIYNIYRNNQLPMSTSKSPLIAYTSSHPGFQISHYKLTLPWTQSFMKIRVSNKDLSKVTLPNQKLENDHKHILPQQPYKSCMFSIFHEPVLSTGLCPYNSLNWSPFPSFIYFANYA